jgi:hypothetical protein
MRPGGLPFGGMFARGAGTGEHDGCQDCSREKNVSQNWAVGHSMRFVVDNNGAKIAIISG